MKTGYFLSDFHVFAMQDNIGLSFWAEEDGVCKYQDDDYCAGSEQPVRDEGVEPLEDLDCDDAQYGREDE